MPESECGCGYAVVCHTHEEEANVILQAFVPHAVAELQRKGMWEGVALEHVTCRMAYGRPWVGVLSRPKPGSEQVGDFQYVLKCGEKYDAATLDAHCVLSEAGISPPPSLGTVLQRMAPRFHWRRRVQGSVLLLMTGGTHHCTRTAPNSQPSYTKCKPLGTTSTVQRSKRRFR